MAIYVLLWKNVKNGWKFDNTNISVIEKRVRWVLLNFWGRGGGYIFKKRGGKVYISKGKEYINIYKTIYI